eukprot:Blabericola_migrator_1__4670@NODE_246_length_10907_cov_93_324631_g208_i0_p2_GENE_NODE_246_length_10907_cov_93_324631_g208_i0NODE_246_length_10907_cov_93_324631_g208_i0_p2_ORF_typecomplete_len509_score80_16_NODE_246_length_10907_cov_93_324631_g208_i069818507
MTTPLKNVFVCCGPPNRNIDDEFQVSGPSPVQNNKKVRGYTPRNNSLVTHGSVWSRTRRASYSTHSRPAIPPVPAPAGLRHHSVDISPHLLQAAEAPGVKGVGKCDTPSTQPPDSPKATGILSSRGGDKKKAAKKKKEKKLGLELSYAPQAVSDSTAFVSYVPPPPPSQHRAPIQKLEPPTSTDSSAPKTTVYKEDDDYAFPSSPRPSEPKSVYVPVKSSPRLPSPTPVPPPPPSRIPSPMQLPEIRRPSQIPALPLTTRSIASPTSHRGSIITSQQILQTMNSARRSTVTSMSPMSPQKNILKPPTTPRKSAASPRDNNFVVPHSLLFSRARQKPQEEDPAARALKPPKSFDIRLTAAFRKVEEGLRDSYHDKERVIDSLADIGDRLVTQGLVFDEVWIAGQAFSRRTLTVFLAPDLSCLWWDANVRRSCPLPEKTSCFTWKQVLKQPRLHPYLMGDQMRELSDDERRRLLVVEAVDHNETLRRHWLISSKPKVAEDVSKLVALLKV